MGLGTLTESARSYIDNIFYVFDVALGLVPTPSRGLTLLHGDARGADKLGGQWGHLNDFRVRIIRPDWERYGQVAGFVRNDALVGGCDAAIVLWDGWSKGTKDTIKKLTDALKPYVLIVRKPESFL